MNLVFKLNNKREKTKLLRDSQSVEGCDLLLVGPATSLRSQTNCSKVPCVFVKQILSILEWPPHTCPGPLTPSNTFLQFIEFTYCYGHKFLELAIQYKREEYTPYDCHCRTHVESPSTHHHHCMAKRWNHGEIVSTFSLLNSNSSPTINITLPKNLHTTIIRPFLELILNK